MDIMSTAGDRKKVEKKIKALATKHLLFTHIMDVKIEPCLDIDGDPILHVDIFHDSAEGLGADPTASAQSCTNRSTRWDLQDTSSTVF